jgi:hypothetical protein
VPPDESPPPDSVPSFVVRKTVLPLRDIDHLSARIEIEQDLAGLHGTAKFDFAFGTRSGRHDIQRRALGAGDTQRVRADRQILGLDLEVGAIAALFETSLAARGRNDAGVGEELHDAQVVRRDAVV